MLVSPIMQLIAIADRVHQIMQLIALSVCILTLSMMYQNGHNSPLIPKRLKAMYASQSRNRTK